MNRRTFNQIALASACVIAIACLKLFVRPPETIEFDSIEACKKHMEAKGFHCVKVADHEYSYLVISIAPLDEGKARAANMKPQSTDIPGVVRARILRQDYLPDCPNLRFWGKVYAFGDSEVINRIDPDGVSQ